MFRCNVQYTQLSSSQKMKKNYTWKFFSFIAGVVDIAENHPFAIISANFRKKLKRSQWHTQGPWGTLIYENDMKSKISYQTPFKPVRRNSSEIYNFLISFGNSRFNLPLFDISCSWCFEEKLFMNLNSLIHRLRLPDQLLHLNCCSCCTAGRA